MVAKAGFDALTAGEDEVIPSAKDKVMGAIADALPDKVAAQVHRGEFEPSVASEARDGE